MRESVAANFWKINEDWEGWVSTCYKDQKGLVSFGLGNLADPVSLLLPAPFERIGGGLATHHDKIAEYRRVKDLVVPEGESRWQWAAKDATIFIPRKHAEVFVAQKLASNEAHIRKLLPNWDSLPADAQFFMQSWCWAVGPNSKYPRMLAAMRRGDFFTAAKECTINPDVETIAERNIANRTLLRNAAYVAAEGMDCSVLHYPRDLDLVTTKG